MMNLAPFWFLTHSSGETSPFPLPLPLVWYFLWNPAVSGALGSGGSLTPKPRPGPKPQMTACVKQMRQSNHQKTFSRYSVNTYFLKGQRRKNGKNTAWWNIVDGKGMKNKEPRQWSSMGQGRDESGTGISGQPSPLPTGRLWILMMSPRLSQLLIWKDLENLSIEQISKGYCNI